MRLSPAKKKKLLSLKTLIYDFDGVMTDNKVLVSSNGTESVRCHRGDGMAIGAFRKYGLHQCILSTETNPVVKARAKKLKLPCVQGTSDKRKSLLAYAKKKKINLKTCGYIGNDNNDLTAMALVGLKIAPKDSSKQILRLADVVLTRKGGDGVVRELLDIFETLKNN